MSNVLFVEDEPHLIADTVEVLREVYPNTLFRTTVTVEEAVRTLLDIEITLIVMDIFIPMQSTSWQSAAAVMGPRAERYRANIRHLGGLALLDELDRLNYQGKILLHTSCTDYELLQSIQSSDSQLSGQICGKLPKPAPMDVLLSALAEHFVD